MSNEEKPLRSAMSICKELYAEILADGYITAEGKSLREEFIARAITEAHLTTKGAGSYWHKMKRIAEGKDPHYRKPKAKQEVAVEVVDIDN